MSLQVEKVGVLQLANCYAAIHCKESQVQFISARLEEKLEPALDSARKFAMKHQITLLSTVQTLQNPILTVIKQDSYWYPAQLFSDQVHVITTFIHPNNPNRTVDMSLDYNGALSVARTMAYVQKCDFIPSIGDSLSK